jgi:predicted HicB family RNase H-like nuclease
MSDLLKYKNYEGTVEYSTEEHRLFGKVLHVDSLILYDGESVPEIEEAFRAAVDGYLTYCAKAGRSPNKPYSGSFNIRIGQELHKASAAAAGRAGIKLNEFVRRAIQEKLASTETQAQAVTHNTFNVYLNQADTRVMSTSGEDEPTWGTAHASTGNAHVPTTH